VTKVFVTTKKKRTTRQKVAFKIAGVKKVRLAPGGVGGGRMRSLRNLVLNWGSVLGGGASAAHVAATSSGPPWLLALALFPVAQQFFPAMSRDLSERHAAVLWTLWQHGAATNRVPDASLRRLVNESLKEYGCVSMTAKELQRVLTDLGDLRCVERTISGWRVIADVEVKG